jgi:ribokinase
MIVVVGSANMDLVVRGNRLPLPGETVLGGRFYQAPGGKGANQAVAAARVARCPVAFVGAVGEDAFGDQLRSSLLADGIDCRFLFVRKDQPTGVAVIMVDASGQNAISVAPGANSTLSVEEIDQAADALWDAADVILVSLEIPLEAAERALWRARKAQVTTILNPAPADRAWAVQERLEVVDWLTPNESEAAVLLARPVHSGSSDRPWFAETACALQKLGVKNVCLTCGRHGAALATGTGIEWFDAFAVEAVDTTAAGDAFNGGLAAALAEGRSGAEAVRFASAVAALSVTRPGAQPSMPYRAELAALLGSGA